MNRYFDFIFHIEMRDDVSICVQHFAFVFNIEMRDEAQAAMQQD